MSSFENLRIVDNFYQTSLYYPMPTVVISTLAEDGSTSLGPYSLIAPYYVAGKGYYAMLLNCRNSSNTAQHILRTGKCAINFINDDPKNFKEAVKLSWPGDEPKDKMPNCKFPLEKSQIMEENPDDVRPMVISDAIQVLECTWMRELDGADRADDKVKFTDDALKTILNVPRVFLPLVLKGCVDWAKENGVELVTEEHMKIINDKRAKEKQKKK